MRTFCPLLIQPFPPAGDPGEAWGGRGRCHGDGQAQRRPGAATVQRTLCAQQTRSTSRSGSPRDPAGLWVAGRPCPLALEAGQSRSSSVPGLPPLRPRARAALQGAAGPGESVPGGTRSVHTPAPPPTPTGHAAGAVLSGAGTRVSPVGWARPFSPALVTLERGERQGHRRGRVLEATALAPELFPSSAVCSSASPPHLVLNVEPVVTTSENPLRRQPRPCSAEGGHCTRGRPPSGAAGSAQCPGQDETKGGLW